MMQIPNPQPPKSRIASRLLIHVTFILKCNKPHLNYCFLPFSLHCTQELLPRIDFHKHMSASFATKDQLNWQICLSKKTLSQVLWATKAFNSISQPWHVDTLFPHISWELALQLSSLFWLPLFSVDAQWSNELSCAQCHHCELLRGEWRAALSSDSSASAPAQVTDWLLITHTIYNIILFSMWVVVSLCRAIFDRAGDQAPHLVYLTSWVGHSVSVSVSLSNTPSEVSLVYSSRPNLGYSTDWLANSAGSCAGKGNWKLQGKRLNVIVLKLWMRKSVHSR